MSSSSWHNSALNQYSVSIQSVRLRRTNNTYWVLTRDFSRKMDDKHSNEQPIEGNWHKLRKWRIVSPASCWSITDNWQSRRLILNDEWLDIIRWIIPIWKLDRNLDHGSRESRNAVDLIWWNCKYTRWGQTLFGLFDQPYIWEYFWYVTFGFLFQTLFLIPLFHRQAQSLMICNHLIWGVKWGESSVNSLRYYNCNLLWWRSPHKKNETSKTTIKHTHLLKKDEQLKEQVKVGSA